MELAQTIFPWLCGTTLVFGIASLAWLLLSRRGRECLYE